MTAETLIRPDFAAANPDLDPAAHTPAPLRMEGVFHFAAAPETVFQRVYDPSFLASWFPMITGGHLDYDGSEAPGAPGVGAKRYCRTSGMGTLDETILYWNPPHGYAYTVKNVFMPIKEHLATMEVVSDGADGAWFRWRQYFNGARPDVVLFKPMMASMMTKGLNALAKELGGQGGKMKVVG